MLYMIYYHDLPLRATVSASLSEGLLESLIFWEVLWRWSHRMSWWSRLGITEVSNANMLIQKTLVSLVPYILFWSFAVASILVLRLQLWFVQRCGSNVFFTGSKGMIYGLVRSWRKDPNPSRFHYVKSQQRDAVSLEFFVKVTILTLQQVPYISKCRGCAEVRYRYLFFNCLMM